MAKKKDIKIVTPIKEFKKEDFKAMSFSPHEFKTEIITANDEVLIIVPLNIVADMVAIAGLVQDEVSWLGTVERDGHIFTVSEIFVPEQTVSAAETEMTEGGIAEIGLELIEADNGDPARCNKLRFWCHTHPWGGTGPSGPDVAQTKKLLESVDDFFIRGIANKKGKIQFTLWLIKEGVTIMDCPWSSELPDLHSAVNFWHKHINEKVSKKNAWAGRHGGAWAGRHGSTPRVGNQIWCQATQTWVEPENKKLWSPMAKKYLTTKEVLAMDDEEKKTPVNTRLWNQANMIMVNSRNLKAMK